MLHDIWHNLICPLLSCNHQTANSYAKLQRALRIQAPKDTAKARQTGTDPPRWPKRFRWMGRFSWKTWENDDWLRLTSGFRGWFNMIEWDLRVADPYFQTYIMAFTSNYWAERSIQQKSLRVLWGGHVEWMVTCILKTPIPAIQIKTNKSQSHKPNRISKSWIVAGSINDQNTL